MLRVVIRSLSGNTTSYASRTFAVYVADSGNGDVSEEFPELFVPEGEHFLRAIGVGGLLNKVDDIRKEEKVWSPRTYILCHDGHPDEVEREVRDWIRAVKSCPVGMYGLGGDRAYHNLHV